MASLFYPAGERIVANGRVQVPGIVVSGGGGGGGGGVVVV